MKMKMVRKVILALLCLMLPLTALAEEAVREMPEPYASAVFTDPSQIPYPEARDENGYLVAGSAVTSYRTVDEKTGELETYETEGEFVYENPAQGLWAYLSPTLQVEIVQYDGNWSKFNQRWFVADVKFDAEAEQFGRHVWHLDDATGMDVLGLNKDGSRGTSNKNQAIYPKSLAQADRMVLAVNGDYYLGRVEKDQATGNILRQGIVLYDANPNKSLSFPNLDSASFFPDGSMQVFDRLETTATEQLENGARDMVSFGPWLIRNGEMRELEGDNYTGQREPRLAIGMVEPGHYVIIDCEGRVPSNRGNGAHGLTLVELRDLLYYHGVNQAINMDGGNTSVLIFMGEKLNLTGINDYVGSPRNQNELFGVGHSDLVRTDWANGKKP